MLGLVLGTLRLPFIVLAGGSPIAGAGTNIAISAAAAGAGALRHAREGRVDWRVVSWIAFPSVAGAVAGAIVADDVSEALLYAAIAAVLVWSGVDLALRRLPYGPGCGFGCTRSRALVRHRRARRSRRRDSRHASDADADPLGRNGHPPGRGDESRRRLPPGHRTLCDACLRAGVDWAILAAGLAGSIPGGWLGARATGRVPENRLRIALGAVLVIVGIAFALQATF
jgi:uncharacterized membrane protein YfcA